MADDSNINYDDKLIGKKSPDDDNKFLSPKEREILSDLQSGKYKNEVKAAEGAAERKGNGKGANSKESKNQKNENNNSLDLALSIEKLLEGEDDDEEEENEINARKYTVYKYTKDIPLAEEIRLGHQNVFLQIIDDKPVISSAINLSKQKNIILKPHESSEMSPVIPYSFKDIDEIKYFINEASQKTIDDLLFMSKSLWNSFVVAKDNDIITMLAIDTIYSYFQDLFATTHYDLVTGSPGSGKGAILGTFKLLAYRVVLASDMSGANLLDILGPVEACQVTVAEDELDDIDVDEDKRRAYKVGYDVNGVIPRTLDGNKSSRSNRYYHVYCLKMFAAENPPESRSLAGFNDRTFRIESIKGKPQFLIKTVLNEMQKPEDKQNPKYKGVIAKINYLRKLLLIYRLLHHEDIIEEVETNIDGRALELTGPQIYLFNSDTLALPKYNGKDNDKDQTGKAALRQALSTLSKFLQKKGELTSQTLEGIIYAMLMDLFAATQPQTTIDVNGISKIRYILPNNDICEEVRSALDGESIPDRQAFYSVEYGKITHKRILKICRDVFKGDNNTTGKEDSRARALSFDKEMVLKIGKSFEIISEIRIIDYAGNSDEDIEDSYGEPVTKIRKYGDTGDIEISEDRQQADSINHSIKESNENPTIPGLNNMNKIQNTEPYDTNIVNHEDDCTLGQSIESNGKPKDGTYYPTDQKIVFPSQNDDKNILYLCYHCEKAGLNGEQIFQTDSRDLYENHGAVNHTYKPMFPTKADLERHGLKPQGKEWEKEVS